MLNSLDAFLQFRWPANVLGIRVRWFFPQLALLTAENYPREYELRAFSVADFFKRFSEGNIVFPSLRVNTNSGDELLPPQAASRKGISLKFGLSKTKQIWLLETCFQNGGCVIIT